MTIAFWAFGLREMVWNDIGSSKRGVDAMFRVGRNQEIRTDVHASPGAFLERDDRQPVEKVIQDLFTLSGGLFRDPITDFC